MPRLDRLSQTTVKDRCTSNPIYRKPSLLIEVISVVQPSSQAGKSHTIEPKSFSMRSRDVLSSVFV